MRFVDGRCVVREKLPGTPLVLVRADRDADDGRWSQAPVGKPRPPAKEPPSKEPPAKRAKTLKRPPPPPPETRAGNLDATNAGDGGRAAPNAEPPPPQAKSPPPPPQAKSPPQPQRPRGDAQVAPQVQQPDTGAQQQQQLAPQKK